MTRYTADLPINVNLNVVAKYHQVTKRKVDRLKKQDIPVNNHPETLTVFIIKDEETNEYHPLFDYLKYAKDAGLDEITANNLLYLFYVNCIYEWGVYSQSLVTETSQDIALVPNADKITELNLALLAHVELMTIKKLCLMLESYPAQTELKFDYISNTKRNEESKRGKHKVFGVKITDTPIVKSVLKNTIEQLFDKARYGTNDILREVLKDRTPDYNTIDSIIKHIPLPHKDLGDALSAFRKYLIDVTLRFLKQEVNLIVDKKNLAQPVALFIYSLFSLLRLINPTKIEDHTDDTDRGKYVRLMAYNPGNIKKKKSTKNNQQDNEPYSFKDIIFKLSTEE